MSFLTVLLVKNSHILDEIYFIFLKNALDQFFIIKFEIKQKNWTNSYQVKQIFTLFCKLVALILG